MNNNIFLAAALLLTGTISYAQKEQKMKPEDTEVWEPVPTIVSPGKTTTSAPSDALILFDGKSLNQWEDANNPGSPAKWLIEGNTLKVNKGAGNIQTRRSFTDYQLHIEWRVPAGITGSGQARGNSGLFLASTGKGDDGYELQILDSYNNPTYVNGQAGSIYKQTPPLVNASRKPGEWQVYDVIWTGPRFSSEGSLQSPARVTVFYNGVLIQNNTVLQGPTQYIGKPAYRNQHGPCPIKLQAHGDKSEPVSFRNIWVREL